MKTDLIPGHAHTPEHKRAIIERLYAVWMRRPELRLGQLIASVHESPVLVYVEDDALMDVLEMTFKEVKREH